MTDKAATPPKKELTARDIQAKVLQMIQCIEELAKKYHEAIAERNSYIAVARDLVTQNIALQKQCAAQQRELDRLRSGEMRSALKDI